MNECPLELISKSSQRNAISKGTAISTSESPSSTTTTRSEDEALYELLGLDRFSLDGSWHDDEKDDKMETIEDANNNTTTGGESKTYIRQHIPPPNCQRPNTLHTPLLLETSPNLLSEAQCSYIIHNLGYRTSNDGGKTYGPTYVTSAAPVRHDNPTFNHHSNHISIDLQIPNPHKVCVFTSDLVLTWMERALHKAGLDPMIQNWVQQNYNHDINPWHDQKMYQLHPRLRMLQYDAQDEDTFPPHYDATTTWKDPHSGKIWESQLTVLLYLTSSTIMATTSSTSSPSSSQTLHSKTIFPGEGGATRFQSILDPTRHHWDYTPQQGTILLFTHELYHSSQPLTRGSKLVLRTDILFPPQMTPKHQLHTNSVAASLPSPTSATTLQQALDTFQETSHVLPLNWEQSLGLDPEEPISHLMSLGSPLFQQLLHDVGWEMTTAQEFWNHYSMS